MHRYAAYADLAAPVFPPASSAPRPASSAPLNIAATTESSAKFAPASFSASSLRARASAAWMCLQRTRPPLFLWSGQVHDDPTPGRTSTS